MTDNISSIITSDGLSPDRLGITLEVTLSIVKNTRVRRTKTDLGVTEFVADIKELSGRFSEALASSGAKSMAVWEAVKPWDETQVTPKNVIFKRGLFRAYLRSIRAPAVLDPTEGFGGSSFEGQPLSSERQFKLSLLGSLSSPRGWVSVSSSAGLGGAYLLLKAAATTGHGCSRHHGSM